MTPTVIVAIIGLVFTVLAYFGGKQKSSNEDREQRGRFEGEIKATLTNLKDSVNELKEKLEKANNGFYKEIDKRIAEHERRYHHSE